MVLQGHLKLATFQSYIRQTARAGVFASAGICCVSTAACGNSSPTSSSTSTGAVTCDACCAELTNGDVRACDLVLDAPTSHTATFGKLVRGSSQQRGEKLAVAFTAKADKGLSGSLVDFTKSDGSTCDLKLSSSTCYDRAGHTMDGVAVVFRGRKK